jgi:hypothetical protein
VRFASGIFLRLCFLLIHAGRISGEEKRTGGKSGDAAQLTYIATGGKSAGDWETACVASVSRAHLCIFGFSSEQGRLSGKMTPGQVGSGGKWLCVFFVFWLHLQTIFLRVFPS